MIDCIAQAICRFNVTILDVNDNAPIFDKVWSLFRHLSID